MTGCKGRRVLDWRFTLLIAATSILLACGGGSSSDGGDGDTESEPTDGGSAEPATAPVAGSVSGPISGDLQVDISRSDDGEVIATTSVDDDNRTWSVEVDTSDLPDDVDLILEVTSDEHDLPQRSVIAASALAEDNEYTSSATTISNYTEATWHWAQTRDTGDQAQYTETTQTPTSWGTHRATGHTGIDHLAAWINEQIMDGGSATRADYQRGLFAELLELRWPAALIAGDDYAITLPSILMDAGIELDVIDSGRVNLSMSDDTLQVSVPDALNSNEPGLVVIRVRDAQGGSQQVELEETILSGRAVASHSIEASQDTELTDDDDTFTLSIPAGAFRDNADMELMRANDPRSIDSESGEIVDLYEVRVDETLQDSVTLTYRVPEGVDLDRVRLGHVDGNSKQYRRKSPDHVDPATREVRFTVDRFSWFSLFSSDEEEYWLGTEFTPQDMNDRPGDVLNFVEDKVIDRLRDSSVLREVSNLARGRDDLNPEAQQTLVAVLSSKALLSFLDLAPDRAEFANVEYRAGLLRRSRSALGEYRRIQQDLYEALFAIAARSGLAEVSVSPGVCGSHWEDLVRSATCNLFDSDSYFGLRQDLDREVISGSNNIEVTTLIYQLLERNAMAADDAVESVVRSGLDRDDSVSSVIAELVDMKIGVITNASIAPTAMTHATCISESARVNAASLELSMYRSAQWAGVPGLLGTIGGEADNHLSIIEGFTNLEAHLNEASVSHNEENGPPISENWETVNLASDLALTACDDDDAQAYIQAASWERIQEIDSCILDLDRGGACGVDAGDLPSDEDEESDADFPGSGDSGGDNGDETDATTGTSVSVESVGPGSGTITSIRPSDTDCGSSCELQVNQGETVHLRAAADEGFQVSNWVGRLTDEGSTGAVCLFPGTTPVADECVFTMPSSSVEVSVEFSPEAALSIDPAGTTGAASGEVIDFEFRATDLPNDMETARFEWTMGAGSAGTGEQEVLVSDGDASHTVSHSYGSDGRYAMTVSVEDPGGGSFTPLETTHVNVIGEPEERAYDLDVCDSWRAANTGGQGITVDNWDLTEIPPGAIFDIRFDARSVPDRYVVEYAGAQVLDTGWRGSSTYDGDSLYPGGIEGSGQGQEDDIFTREAGFPEVRVTVEGPDSGTIWSYDLRCRISGDSDGDSGDGDSGGGDSGDGGSGDGGSGDGDSGDGDSGDGDSGDGDSGDGDSGSGDGDNGDGSNGGESDAPAEVTLTVTTTGDGEGTITSNPTGLDCGLICELVLEEGGEVTLEATADEGSEFTGWTEPCSDADTSPTCTLVVDTSTDVSAAFDEEAPVDDGNGASQGDSIWQLTASEYAYDSDHAAACASEFGPEFDVAEWNDFSPAVLDAFFEDVEAGVGSGSIGFVTRNGEQFYSSSRAYLVARHDGDVPSGWLVHDDVSDHTLSLGSWDSDRPVICYNSESGVDEPIGVARPLNDTGIDWCADGSTNYNSGDAVLKRQNCDSVAADYPGQDGMYGRDAQARDGDLEKVGSGAAGFDFTKLDAGGNDLSADADEWSCVRDNHTGLIWEVKTDDGERQDQGHEYTWYESSYENVDGRSAGFQDGGSCSGTRCDTQGYAESINAQGLCGAGDWRLPTVDELFSVAHYGVSTRSTSEVPINEDFFPNTAREGYWSATPYAGSSNRALMVSFMSHVFPTNHSKDTSARVRLVRTGK